MNKRPLISVVINTLEEGKNISACLNSVKSFADEIIVVDMYSSDKTREIAKKKWAKVFLHRKTGYLEPARNFAINKANGKWVLLLDADERLRRGLARRLKQIAKDPAKNSLDAVLIPRKNIIFGKWMENSRWWPDYLPRFFRRTKIKWPEQIHQQPKLTDKTIFTLPALEKFAIVHYNYTNLDQFLERNKRYSRIQAKELIKIKNYQLSTKDLLLKPLEEFLSRFFPGEAYKDGVHGLALSLLQAWAVLLIYLKVWEKQKYQEKPLEPKQIKSLFSETMFQLEYWRDDFILKNNKTKFKFMFGFLSKLRKKIVQL